MNPPTPFDWHEWLVIVANVLRQEPWHGFSRTLLPLFKAAPPPPVFPADEDMTLVTALWCAEDDEMRNFLFSIAIRDPNRWRNTFEWGELEIMFALKALECDKVRPPMREFFDMPDEAADLFDRFKTTRDQALTLFHPLAFQFDGDKAIRTRVAKFLITPPVNWEYDDWVIEIDGERFWLVDDDDRDEILAEEAAAAAEAEGSDSSDESDESSVE
jgi:hypothetical protein